MECPQCNSANVKANGKNRNGTQRYKCRDCKKTFTEGIVKPLGGMRLPVKTAVQCLKLLMEGISIRAVERLLGVHRDTICDLILTVGDQCREFLDHRLKNVPVANVQVDEVWSFVGCKQKTADINGYDGSKGDAYAFIGLERTSKLIVSWHLGKRDTENTYEFADNLAKATSGQFQCSTDGWKPYRTALPQTFGAAIDYAMVIKVFATPAKHEQHRYSPAKIAEVKQTWICGNPDPKMISTSHVERSNLTLRMTLRRWTRLTNAHSKSWKHHDAALALYLAVYNYVRPHMTIKTTPAVAAGIADHPWTMEELLTAVAV